ncbi:MULTISPECIES: hypothetical protein [unclassified Acinetobacter]|uniref:DUF6985 domain-containing protein n=1 Tax=unclassified Acinetobacter TaxID=196816 RepID=UPI0018A9BD0C|nr:MULTISPECIES: hypothetical protein [unclassified Acinetobacter]MBJ9952484.1 hypothetical protein [Acinetobacter baumannii]
MKHDYWGEIHPSWAGFSSETFFSHAFFNQHADREIFLGEEFDEEGNEIEQEPDQEQLSAFARTYQKFLQNFDQHLKTIQQYAFERYQKLYAHHYENPEKSGEAALNIHDVEAHNSYIQTMLNLRVSSPDTLRLCIHYDLDTEHGMEFKFVNDQLESVAGIAET